MFKSFAAATLASYTAAQSAVVTEYSVSTGTIQNTGKTEDVATSSLSMIYQELVNGVNSYTVMNQTCTMTLAAGTTWSTDADALVQIVVCYPYMNTAGTEVNECQEIYVTNLTSTSVPNYSYARYPSVTKQPTFGTTSTLDD